MRTTAPVLHWAREAFEPDPEEEKNLAYARTHLDLGEVIRAFGTWAVTDYGLESLTRYYPIEKKRLGENWPRQMAGKNWVDMGDFMDAYEAAKRIHHGNKTETQIRRRAKQLTPAERFAILQRDGFRCQLCGRTAEDGIKLHVDHKVPIAQGGSSDKGNLWTLCNECNAGKAARLMGEQA